MNDSTWARVGAIATGAVAASGALYILLKDDVLAGQWSDSFVLVPAMVVIAVAAGHLAVNALMERKVLSAIGFAMAFALGTALTVYTSVGKQATSSDANYRATEAHAKAIRDKQADLERARLRYQQATAQADKEISEGGCKKKCDDWRLRAREVQSHIATLETELTTMGSAKPVAAGADRVAQLAAMVLGADSKHVKAVLVLVEPFLFTLL
jgi:septal ring factor EnvC (AmiA/AmiB activator)